MGEKPSEKPHVCTSGFSTLHPLGSHRESADEQAEAGEGPGQGPHHGAEQEGLNQ